jgi:hypothetical protein
MEHEALNDDLQAITDSLADVMIARKISLQTMLMGMHAFLMAVQESGHADAAELSEELSRMAEYYRLLVRKN